MSTSQPIPWKHIALIVFRYVPLWGGATLLFAGLGVAICFFRTDTWEVSQPLLIRDEATGAAQRMGRFSSQTELIAAQETILEMARNREVVEQALRVIGPPDDHREATWPTAKIVDDVATSNINVRAPKSSEFGKTEVVYLVTKADSPDRATELCSALYKSLADHLRTVRRVRADSIIAELVSARDLAKQHLDDATRELQKLEMSVGTDLGELRGLSESVTSEVSSSRVLSEVQRDLRQAELDLQKQETLQLLLSRCIDNPEHLLVSDGELLSSQPTLQRLKAGLIDAQLATSQLSGRVRPEHPQMLSATLTLQTIRGELAKEIASVHAAMETSLSLSRDRVTSLVAKQTSIQEKLASLAAIRVDYSRLVAEVKHRTELLSNAQAALADAEALRSASLSTNLLSELGPPRASEKPVGPGRSTITAGAAAAGLLFGFGSVFLIAPGPSGNSFGRRLTDRPQGRRASDQFSGDRRATGANLTSESPQIQSPVANPPVPAEKMPAVEENAPTLASSYLNSDDRSELLEYLNKVALKQQRALESNSPLS
jgi:hypothetical protein